MIWPSRTWSQSTRFGRSAITVTSPSSSRTVPVSLPSAAAGGGGAVAVAERDGAVEPVGERAGGLRRVLGLLLQDGEEIGGQRRDLADRHLRQVPEPGTIGGGVHLRGLLGDDVGCEVGQRALAERARATAK